MMRSSRSPLPVPCRPEIGIGSPSPSRCSSSASGSWRGSSILFASTSTGLCDSRRIWATSSSPGVTPARASTTKSTRSASATASRACCAIARVSGVWSAMSTPPVSTSTKRLPVHSQTSSLRSRVTPGISWTTAARVSVSRLTSVDLPTFGKPTIATAPISGGGGGAGSSPASMSPTSVTAGSVTGAASSRAGGTATRGRPASCRSRSQRQSRCSSPSICCDASRYPLPPRGSPSKRIGSPHAIETGAKLPTFHRCEPWIAAQTTGTSSCSATIAAPGCTCPGTPLRCRVPSTKTPSALPLRTTSRIRRTASRSDSPRRTESVPKPRMTCPSPGTPCASTLARK